MISPIIKVPSVVDDVTETTVGIAEARMFSMAPMSGLPPLLPGRRAPL